MFPEKKLIKPLSEVFKYIGLGKYGPGFRSLTLIKDLLIFPTEEFSIYFSFFFQTYLMNHSEK